MVTIWQRRQGPRIVSVTSRLVVAGLKVGEEARGLDWIDDGDVAGKVDEGEDVI